MLILACYVAIRVFLLDSRLTKKIKEMNYTVDYFINKFENIPEDEWYKGDFHSHNGDQHCALGHCDLDYRGSHVDKMNKESLALQDLFISNLGVIVHSVNDDFCHRFKQSTAKQRILAALYDIKKLQQPAYEDLTKTLAMLPIEETPDLIKPKVCQL